MSNKGYAGAFYAAGFIYWIASALYGAFLLAFIFMILGSLILLALGIGWICLMGWFCLVQEKAGIIAGMPAVILGATTAVYIHMLDPAYVATNANTVYAVAIFGVPLTSYIVGCFVSDGYKDDNPFFIGVSWVAFYLDVLITVSTVCVDFIDRAYGAQ